MRDFDGLLGFVCLRARVLNAPKAAAGAGKRGLLRKVTVFGFCIQSGELQQLCSCCIAQVALQMSHILASCLSPAQAMRDAYVTDRSRLTLSRIEPGPVRINPIVV